MLLVESARQATASEEACGLAVPLGHGATELPSEPGAALVLDRDDDLRSDLFVYLPLAGQGLVFSGTTAGLELHQTLELHPFLIQWQFADLNGDDRDDLVAIDEFNLGVATFFANASGSYVAGQFLPLQMVFDGLSLLDANQDQLPDIVATSSESETIQTFLNIGGAFLAPISSQLPGLSTSTAAIRLESNERDGLATMVAQDGIVFLLESDGEGHFGLSDSLVVEESAGIIVVADIDGDNRDDVAILGSGGTGERALHLWYQGATGSFAQGPTIAKSFGPTVLHVDDIDTDEIPDLLMASSDAGEATSIGYWHGLGQGEFAPVGQIPVGRNVLRIGAGDIQNDGTRDVLLVHGGSPSIWTAPMASIGNWAVHASGGASSIAQLWPIPAGENGRCRLAAGGANLVRILEIDDFGTPIVVGSSGLPLNGLGHMAIGDIFGDTAPELITVDGREALLSVYQINSGGVYELRESRQYGFSDGPIVIDDLDGDGRLDVIINSCVSRAINSLLARGESLVEFESEATDVAVCPTRVIGFDCDGDAYGDLALHPNNGDVCIYKGLGDGRFLLRSEIPSGGAIDMHSGNLDEGDVTDILVFTGNVAPSSSEVRGTAWLGDGQGGFTEGGAFVLGSVPSQVWITDCNDDGSPELGLLGFLTGVFSRIERRQSLEWVTTQRFGVASRPTAAVMLDTDKDGTQDLLAADPNSNTFRVVRGIGTVDVAQASLTASIQDEGVKICWSVSEFLPIVTIMREYRRGLTEVVYRNRNQAPIDIKQCFVDQQVSGGSSVRYRLIGVDRNGDETSLAVTNYLDTHKPSLHLAVNEDDGRLEFVLTGAQDNAAELRIYSITGRLLDSIRLISEGDRQAVVWDPAGSNGAMASGVYLAQVRVGIDALQRKFVYLSR